MIRFHLSVLNFSGFSFLDRQKMPADIAEFSDCPPRAFNDAQFISRRGEILMAHLWMQDKNGWGARKLDAALYDLAAAPIPHAGEAMGTPSAKTAQLIRADAGGLPAWALIASPDSGVRVNSRAVPAGLCVLADRDEIRTGDGD